jgi:hypothetical protein
MAFILVALLEAIFETGLIAQENKSRVKRWRFEQHRNETRTGAQEYFKRTVFATASLSL